MLGKLEGTLEGKLEGILEAVSEGASEGTSEADALGEVDGITVDDGDDADSLQFFLNNTKYLTQSSKIRKKVMIKYNLWDRNRLNIQEQTLFEPDYIHGDRNCDCGQAPFFL